MIKTTTKREQKGYRISSIIRQLNFKKKKKYLSPQVSIFNMIFVTK